MGESERTRPANETPPTRLTTATSTMRENEMPHRGDRRADGRDADTIRRETQGNESSDDAWERGWPRHAPTMTGTIHALATTGNGAGKNGAYRNRTRNKRRTQSL